MAGERSDERPAMRVCGKHDCTNFAVVRIRVDTVLQKDQFVACHEHRDHFVKMLSQMLDLPAGADWRIAIETLTYRTSNARWAARPFRR